MKETNPLILALARLELAFGRLRHINWGCVDFLFQLSLVIAAIFWGCTRYPGIAHYILSWAGIGLLIFAGLILIMHLIDVGTRRVNHARIQVSQRKMDNLKQYIRYYDSTQNL